MAVSVLKNKNISVIIPILVIGIVLLFFIPIPTFMLDSFQAINITMGVTILLISMYVKEPLNFSIFPSVLLVTTLFRLAVNMASTKLILLKGLSFDGKLIRTFGDFVVGGNYLIGIIVFIILVVMQFLVITKGSERVAEVGARFTLDAMPGKQMSIDADYNAGLITEDEARSRRRKVQEEADFYGSMDGASKFVKGDAIAGIIIVIVNIIGGLIVGLLRGEALIEAAQTYVILTIGDGLVAQIPALLISVATGMIVTKSGTEEDFGTDFINQFFQEPKVLYIVSGTILIMGLIPGMPKIPFFLLSVGLGSLGYIVAKSIQEISTELNTENIEEDESSEDRNSREVKDLLRIDPMELELGYSLIPLVDKEQGGDLLERITMIRKQIAMELGIIVPYMRIRDNMQLNPNEYSIKIKNSRVTKGDLMVGSYLAMNPGNVMEEIAGIPTVEPAFNLPAIWISEDQRERGELLGYTVVDPTSVLATHITETIKKYAPDILDREIVKELIENIKKDYSVIVEEVYPKKFDLGEIQTVMQNLLSEGVSIRNLPLILEAIADAAKLTTNLETLSEYVRSGIARQISNSLQGFDGKLRVLTLNPELEENLRGALQETDLGNYLALNPDLNNSFIYAVNEENRKCIGMGYPAILLVAPELRKPIRRILERDLRGVTVLSYNEIVADIELEAVGMVSVD
ncbi:MAG: flagellar biosynthesis protein FlhA [Fusobacteriaceae bacterium]|nr:flagellar biosynthesis protein FlhA [Fusobacteriaceae bacterium]MBP6466494.1 flagellar biosynthesis protein FlhA [Fusobacteriaceae bacterium]MBP9595321.1 flagellar biosynthesis protein FlhA [Fusobacteriaceae bacterium]MBU9916918.1 flagellar biosynthesis protein FlhA [Fusobacteriaceae bacterium]